MWTWVRIVQLNSFSIALGVSEGITEERFMMGRLISWMIQKEMKKEGSLLLGWRRFQSLMLSLDFHHSLWASWYGSPSDFQAFGWILCISSTSTDLSSSDPDSDVISQACLLLYIFITCIKSVSLESTDWDRLWAKDRMWPCLEDRKSLRSI